MSADLRERIKGLLSKPVLAGFATVRPGGKPWVRYVMIMTKEDLSEIRFATYSDSRKIQDIEEQPEVHLTAGDESLTSMGPYLQIEGRAEFTQDEQERHALWTPGFEAYFEGPDDPRYGIVIIRPYRFEYWTPPGREPEVLETVPAAEAAGR